MRKENLSALMDGELPDNAAFVVSLSQNEQHQATWYRYHLARDTLRGSVNKELLGLDFSKQMAELLADETIMPVTEMQPVTAVPNKPTTKHLWWPGKQIFGRIAQAGLAACVTLAVIGGVQQFSANGVDNDDQQVLNTTPIGVNVSLVGGLNNDDYQLNEQRLAKQTDKAEYERLRRLLQDYELQKRISVNR